MVSPDVKRMSARELFAAARRASKDAEFVVRRLERMRESEGVRGASLAPSTSHSRADVNGTARVDARMDYEVRARAQLDEDLGLIDYARSVLYGAPGGGVSGLARLFGMLAADLLCCYYLGWRYCTDPRPDLSLGSGLMTWAEAAEDVGVPERSAYRKAQEALDLVDMYTPEVVMGGRGEAED